MRGLRGQHIRACTLLLAAVGSGRPPLTPPALLPVCLPAVEVPAGVTTDVLGQPNAGVNYSMIYMPTNAAAVSLGEAMK